MRAAAGAPQALALCAALLCAAMAVWLSARQGQELRRLRTLLAGGGSLTAAGPAPWAKAEEALGRLRQVLGERRELMCLPVGCAVSLLGRSLLPLLGSLMAVPLVRRWLAARRLRRERESREAAVIELCGTVAGDLRAGRQPGEVLAGVRLPELGSAWPAVSAAARYGGEVPAALRRAAGQPGAEGLNAMAACWQVAVEGGAGLAAGLERIGAALSAERDQREELAAQLAGTRSTAVMLALLPVLALLMGSALGADPLRVLLHTPAGLGCLALGGLLEGAGVVWTRRIVQVAGAPEGRRGG
ncbi:type II secretion system F family protein [Streptomyces orinoci]|uniref:Type II secretion system F family protein n=1 Tax=Streptomyces orinoci TaxID=67339 RepID=A0ABV3JXQ3_STRON|nr:type II secretion system F family protein [Streptomyces orinoci]